MILSKLENSDHQLQSQLHRNECILIIVYGLVFLVSHRICQDPTWQTKYAEWERNLSEFMVFSFHQNPQPLRHKHNDNPKSIASINLISWVKLILADHLPQRHISPKSMAQFTRETHTPTLSTWANDWQWKEPMMVASKATRPPRLRTLRRFIHDASWIKGSKTLFTSSNNLQRL